MSKTKFRSLGMGFLLAALILALVTVIWPFVPQSLKSQLDAVNLPIVSEGANEASVIACFICSFSNDWQFACMLLAR